MSAMHYKSRSMSLPHHHVPASSASLSIVQNLPSVKLPAVLLSDPFTRFPEASVSSAEDMASWLYTHKSDTDVKADFYRFEEGIKESYDLERSRNEAWYIYQDTAYAIQRRKAEFDQQISGLRKILQSEDKPSKELAKVSHEATKSQNFKTAILAQINEGDPEQVGATLLLNQNAHPIVVQSRDETQFTLLPSELIFRFSGIERDGMLEDMEELEDSYSGKSKSWSDVTLAVDCTYWRLHCDGDRFFVAPKTKHKHVKREDNKSEDNKEETWVRDESAGDIFLAIGWLVEKSKDGQAQTTRYACALNLSTDPVSMWLIYDYRQPNDDGYLHTSNVPAVGEPNLYLDPEDDCQVIPSTTAASEAAMGKEAGQEKYNGYMDQPAPWDIACLYQDVTKDWPKDSDAAAARAKNSTALFPYGIANTNLRAKRTKPTTVQSARHPPADVLNKE